MESDAQELLRVLVQQKSTLQALNRVARYASDLTPQQFTAPILKNRVIHLQHTWTDCHLLDQKLQRLATDDDHSQFEYFHNNQFEAAEELYITTLDSLETRISALSQDPLAADQNRAVEAAPRSHSQSQHHIKYPRIILPTFSGKPTDWAEFKDTFTSLVLTNEDLTPLEKLQYLKSSAQGEARDILCNVKLLLQNFDTAWESLETRYASKRATVNAHIDEIFSIAPMKRESAQALVTIRTLLKKNLDALRNLGRPVDSYTDILVNRIVERLDARTQRDGSKVSPLNQTAQHLRY